MTSKIFCYLFILCIGYPYVTNSDKSPPLGKPKKKNEKRCFRLSDEIFYLISTLSDLFQILKILKKK